MTQARAIAGAGAGAELPNVVERQEMQQMLGERVETWSEECKAQDLAAGRRLGLTGRDKSRRDGEARMLGRQLMRRFGALPGRVGRRLGTASQDQSKTWAD